MKFSPFLLEEQYDKSESRCQICLGSATANVGSLSDLLSFYSEADKVKILKGLLDLKLDYSERFGARALREKIANQYSSKLSAENILTTSGASEAIFLVFTTLFEKGDTIVVQQPIYQSLYQVAADMGVKVISWDYDFHRDFDYNLENLKKLFTKNQRNKSKIKALVLNNPNNPTGIAFDQAQLTSVASLCEIFGQDRDLFLIVDEVFGELAWKPHFDLVSALDVYDKSIVISDLSKSYGFPGLRMGWIAVANAISSLVIEKLAGQKHYLSLRTAQISEYLAPFILDKKKEIVAEKIKYVHANLEYLDSLDSETLPFAYEAKQIQLERGRSNLAEQSYGGLCLFLQIKEEYQDFFTSESLEALLDEHGLLVISGALFGDKYKNYMRLGLGIAPEEFQAAMNILLLELANKKLTSLC